MTLETYNIVSADNYPTVATSFFDLDIVLSHGTTGPTIELGTENDITTTVTNATEVVINYPQ